MMSHSRASKGQAHTTKISIFMNRMVGSQGCSYYVGIVTSIVGGFFKEHNASIIGTCTFSNVNRWVQSCCLLILYMFVPLAAYQYPTSLACLSVRLQLIVRSAAQPQSHVHTSQWLLAPSIYMFVLHSRCMHNV